MIAEPGGLDAPKRKRREEGGKRAVEESEEGQSSWSGRNTRAKVKHSEGGIEAGRKRDGKRENS